MNWLSRRLTLLPQLGAALIKSSTIGLIPYQATTSVSFALCHQNDWRLCLFLKSGHRWLRKRSPGYWDPLIETVAVLDAQTPGICKAFACFQSILTNLTLKRGSLFLLLPSNFPQAALPWFRCPFVSSLSSLSP